MSLSKYLTKINEPECFGPGKWDDMHLLSINAITYKEKMDFIRYIRLILSNLRCSSCRDDSLGYLKEHPITDYWDRVYKGERIGFFLWTVDFHNWVNKKIAKPTIKIETAYELYKYPLKEICEGDCDKAKETTENISFYPL